MNTHEMPNVEVPAGSKHNRFLSPAHREAVESGQWGPQAAIALWQDQWAYVSSDLAGIPEADPNGSHPWDWLIGNGAITIRWSADETIVRTVAAMPNKPAWWLSLAGVLAALIALFRRPTEQRRNMLLAFWGASMAALVILDRSRVMYAYHYLLPLIAGHGLLAQAWREHGLPRIGAWIAIAAVTAWFAATWALAANYPVPIWWCEMFLHDCGG